jgi:hypothetical protein
MVVVFAVVATVGNVYNIVRSSGMNTRYSRTVRSLVLLVAWPSPTMTSSYRRSLFLDGRTKAKEGHVTDCLHYRYDNYARLIGLPGLSKRVPSISVLREREGIIIHSPFPAVSLNHSEPVQ